MNLTGASESNSPRRSLIRIKDVISRTGLSRSVIYARMAAGTFPRPVTLGAATVCWVDDEVGRWIDEQIAARDAPK